MKKLLTTLLLPCMFASSTCLFTSASRFSKTKIVPTGNANAPRHADNEDQRNRFSRLPSELVDFMGLNNVPAHAKLLDIHNIMPYNGMSIKDIIDLRRTADGMFDMIKDTRERVLNEIPVAQNGNMIEDIMRLSEDTLDAFIESIVDMPEMTTDVAELIRNIQSVDDKRTLLVSLFYTGATIVNDFIDNGNNNE